MPNEVANEMGEFLESVSMAPTQNHRGLSLIPLVASGHRPATAFRCLADAIADGSVRVDEVSAGGSVPRISLDNRGAIAVLVLFGEEIVGAKQNRVANSTFLVAPHSRVDLDVSCVEEGRWSSSPGGFAPGAGVLSSSARQRMSGNVLGSVLRGGGFDANQGDVWAEVRSRVETMRRPSATGAYAEYASSFESELAEAEASFPVVDGQVGLLAFHGDTVEGLELVADPDVYPRVHRRLLRAYTIDVVDSQRAPEPAEPSSDTKDPAQFLRAVCGSPVHRGPSRGLGEDVRYLGPDVSGSALVCSGLVHLMAFPKGSDEPIRASRASMDRLMRRR